MPQNDSQVIIPNHAHTIEMWAQIIWDENSHNGTQPVPGFASEQALREWMLAHNHFEMKSGMQPVCTNGVTHMRPWHGHLAPVHSHVNIPHDLIWDDKGNLFDCPPGTIIPPARSFAPPPPPPPPPPPAPEARDPFFALPQHVTPTQREQLRIQGYLLLDPSIPADFPARRQVDRGTAAGTWEGRNPAHLDGQYGPWGATIGSFFPPFGTLIGALAGTGADMASLRARPNLQSDLAARQPNADSRVNMLEGWRLNAQGLPERIHPGDRLNQPDESHNTDGLISGRYTLATVDPHQNWDIATQARISAALGAPNVQVGLTVIQYLQPKIGEAYNAFHTRPTQENGQRVLNLIAAAGATDVAQMGGTVDAMAHMQDGIIAEARAAHIELHAWDLHNPASIPDLNTLGVHLTARSYADIKNDPGFADNHLSEADYNRLFAGRNLDSFYSYARTGQNTVTRDLGLGGVVTPDNKEVVHLASDGIGFIDRSPATRAAFRDQVAHDTGSDHPNQFGGIINKSLNDMVHQPQSWGFRSRDEAIAYANSLVGEDVVNRQYLQRTATPEPKSDGRTRDEAAAGAAFARLATDDGIHDWLQRIQNHPQDRAAPENRPGVYAQAVLHQFSLQGTQEPGFNAIATAGNLTPDERTRFHNDITRVTSYEVMVSRGGRYRPEDEQRAQTDAFAAVGERRFTAVGPDGVTSLPNQPVRDGIRTRDDAVVGIEARRAANDNSGATLAAVRDIMSNKGTTAASLEALGAYDRTTALNVVLEGIARDPHAFHAVIDQQIRHSQRTSSFFGLLHSDGERGRFADRLERAGDRYRHLMNRQQSGHSVSEADFAAARSRVEGYIALIDDAAAGRTHLIQDLDDDGRPTGRPHPPRTDAEYDQAAQGALATRRDGNATGPVTFVDEKGQTHVLSGHAADAARRAANPSVRAEQYSRANAGQDTIITLLQAIGANPDANRATARVIDGITTGRVLSHNTTITGARVAAAVPETIIAASGEQNASGIDARSITIRPDGAAAIVAANTGDTARIQASLQASLSGMTSGQIQAALQPGARGADAARIQAAIHAAVPGADVTQIQAAIQAAIQAQSGNINSGSRIDMSSVPTKPGVLTGDIFLIIVGAIVPFIHHHPHHPETPQTPIDHTTTPGCCDPVIGTPTPPPPPPVVGPGSPPPPPPPPH